MPAEPLLDFTIHRKERAAEAARQIRDLMADVDLADLPTDLCPCCSAKLVTYRHSLNKALVVGLRRLALAGGKANLGELGLTRNQWDNFQKLRYFGLVEKVTGQKGCWRVTAKGHDWLSGRVKVHKTAITFKGETVGLDGDHVQPGEVDDEYQQREHYAQAARPIGEHHDGQSLEVRG